MKNFILQVEDMPDSRKVRVTLTEIKKNGKTIVDTVDPVDAPMTALGLLKFAFRPTPAEDGREAADRCMTIIADKLARATSRIDRTGGA